MDILKENFNFLNCAVGFIVGWIAYRWTSCRLQNFPPGPLGFPIVGSIPYFESHAEKTLAAWSKIYGPVMMVDIGTTRNVILNSFESIEEVCIKFCFKIINDFMYKKQNVVKRTSIYTW